MGLRTYGRERRKRLATSINYHGVEVPLTGPHVAVPIREQLFADVYERPEIEAAKALIRKGDRVLELGTGMGVVTAILSRATGSDGVVRTYEANPDMLPPAADLFKRNGVTNVEAIHGVLVTDGAGVRLFHFAEFFPEGSLRQPGSKTGEVEVPAYDLQETLKEFNPNVLVCDIEGAEAELVPALDLSGLRSVVIELHPHRLTDAEIRTIYDHMIADGLYPRIEHSGGTVVAFDRFQTP